MRLKARWFLMILMLGGLAARWEVVSAPGDQKWAFIPPRLGATTAPSLGPAGTVLFGCLPGMIYSVDSATGILRWELDTGGAIFDSTPAAGPDGTVYIGSSLGMYHRGLHAIDGNTGHLKWTFFTQRGVNSSPALGPDGTVYFVSDGYRLHALDALTGEWKWDFRFRNTGGPFASSAPAVGADGTVYVGSTDGYVYAVEGTSGTGKWEFETGAEIRHSPALGEDGTLYIGSDRLYALNGRTGDLRWETEPNRRVSTSAIITTHGTIIAGFRSPEGSRLRALDGGTGAELWWLPADASILATPALAADDVLYVAMGTRLLRVDARSGALLSEGWELGAEVSGQAPLIGPDGTVYCYGSGGALVAIEGNKPPAASPWPLYRQGPERRGQGQDRPPQEPIITLSPTAKMISEGGTLRLVAAAVGMPPLSYQWEFDGHPLTGATDALLEVQNVAASATGTYRLVATNPHGSATSVEAWVEVRPFHSWPIGTSLWTRDFGLPLRAAPAVGPDGSLYMGDGMGRVHALDPASGRTRWFYPTAGALTASVVVGDHEMIYAASDRLYALHAQTGELLWALEGSSPVHPQPPLWIGLPRSGFAAPATGGNGLLYAIRRHQFPETNHLLAVDARLRTLRWSAAVSGHSLLSPDGGVAVGPEGSVYAAGFGALAIYAFDGTSGIRHWQTPEASYRNATISVDFDGTILVSTAHGGLAALHPDTGHPKWELAWSGDVGTARPAVGLDGLLLAVDPTGRLLALNLSDGSPRWSFETESPLQGVPAITSDGTVYVGSADRRLYALDAANGAKRWEYLADDQLRGSPIIAADGTVYVGSLGGLLHAVKGTAGPAASAWPMQAQNARNTARQPGKAPRLRIERLPDGSMRVEGDTAGVTRITVETSSDLVHWQSGIEAAGGNPGVMMIVPTNNAAGFVRLRGEPVQSD
jgi:outer membrane protein assembly factor BamB